MGAIYLAGLVRMKKSFSVTGVVFGFGGFGWLLGCLPGWLLEFWEFVLFCIFPKLQIRKYVRKGKTPFS